MESIRGGALYSPNLASVGTMKVSSANGEIFLACLVCFFKF